MTEPVCKGSVLCLYALVFDADGLGEIQTTWETFMHEGHRRVIFIKGTQFQSLTE